jgi:2-phospho-L-lactate guanylyltransferase
MSLHPLWALVAVRSGLGKQRLAGVLDPEQRRALVMAMAGDVLVALVASPEVDGIAVTTADPDLAALAQGFGSRIIMERDGAGGLNAALSHAAALLKADGANSLLIVHGDVPTVTPGDIATLVAAHTHGITIARAVSDGGTNALLLTPPDAIALHFGKDSCAAHLAAADEGRIAARVLAIPGLSADIDEPEDLRQLAAGTGEGRAAQLARDLAWQSGPLAGTDEGDCSE